MTSTEEALLYSVSSTFNEFDKLQGAKNYTAWKRNMRTLLVPLRQWDVVTGTVVPPIPVDAEHPTAEESKAKEAWDVRERRAFMEIYSRVANTAKNVLGNTQNPRVAWGLLEKHFAAKPSELISKLQLAAWDGSDVIHTHRDHMVNLRIQMADAGMALSDQAFYTYFTLSLPPSLDLLVAVCEDNNYDIDSLCDKIAKYEMRQKLRAIRSGNAEAASNLF
jgi:hypothetical protein